MSAGILPLPMRMKPRARVRGVVLNEGELLTRDLGPEDRLEVTVLSGDLWITQESDPEDYALRSGDRLMLTGTGKVVIESLEQLSEFTVGEL